MKCKYLLVFFIAGCSSSNQYLDTGEVLDLKLVLSYENNICVVASNTDTLKLPVKGPCFFVRSGKKIQMFSYNDQEVDGVIAIVGNPVDEAVRQQWKVDEDAHCGSEVTGLIIRDKKLSISPTVLREGVYCPDIGLDEKVFWGLAHDKQ